MDDALTLLDLNRRLASLIVVPSTQNVWVTAELSDVSVRGGHCYMDLLQKDPERGTIQARARAVVWASAFPRINDGFVAATGQSFSSGIKVMVRVSATMHPVYGMSLIVNAVNPEYTMGDLLRRRREIIERLRREGILEMNRSLVWPDVPQRIAIVSAPGAAGYGDFINQLYNNQYRLRFNVRLFPAVMQGESSPLSIIAALERIMAQSDDWDGVVIIRGGGATSDLAAFEDYDLAANVAQFPLPVIIGIGHERDVTVLDYVANMRVKTPTAAAEWLVARGVSALDHLRRMGSDMLRCVTDCLSGCRSQLAYIEGSIPAAVNAVIQECEARSHRHMLTLATVGARRVSPQLARLDHISDSLVSAVRIAMERKMTRLSTAAQLIETLSPQSTLRRGYSITRVDGRAVTSVSQIPQGSVMETTVADGKIRSVKIDQE